MSDQKNYDAQSITVLKGLEAVKKRPGMYIGDTEDGSGLHHMIYEVVDNCVDEALAGHCNKIVIELHKDGSCSVEDNGRGIPVGMHEEGISAAEVIMTQLHAGGKFDKDSYKISGGLHGVGVSVVNALSEWLELYINKEGKRYFMRFEEGFSVSPLKEIGESTANGTYIRFKPSDKTFNNVLDFSLAIVETKIRELSFLNSKIHFVLKDHRDDTNKDFLSQGGLVEYIEYINKSKNKMGPIVSFKGAQNDIEVEIAMQWTDSYHENFICFTNNIRQRDGGTHLSGFKNSTTRVINNYCEIFIPQNIRKKIPEITGDDIREGLAYVISTKVPDPKFSSQTKDKLVSSDVRTVVEAVVSDCLNSWLEKNPNEAKMIVQKIQQSAVAREAAKKARDITKEKRMEMPSKLADCQSNDPTVKELYIVEGESAGGTAKQGRDRKTQAVLALRGKILNVEKVRIDRILSTDSIRSLISTLGTGIGKDDFDINKARYHKVVIMTDADVDGSHIRTLLLTFFYRYMPEVIQSGYLYISQPPLYRVKQGSKVNYIKNDAEMASFLIDSALKNVSSTHDVDILVNSLSKMYNIIKKDKHCSSWLLENACVAGLSSKNLDDNSIADFIEVLNKSDTTKSFAFEEKTADKVIVSNIKKGIKYFYELPLESLFVCDNVIKNCDMKLIKEVVEKTLDVKWRGDLIEFNSCVNLFEIIIDKVKSSASIQRFKGLGEMNTDQLWDTTLNPETRTLLQVRISDFSESDSVFSMLMGDDVLPRRNFIIENSQNVDNIDA